MNQSLAPESVLLPEFTPPPAADTTDPGHDTGTAASMAGKAGPHAPQTAGRAPSAPGDSGDGPAALADLVAAGLVSHEMIGDPARLGSEAVALRRLCAHVPGSIWRIEPYHYAFRLEAGIESEAAAAALEAHLASEFGPDAAWVSPADLIAEVEGAAGDTATGPAAGSVAGKVSAAPGVDLDAPLLLLRAGAEAVDEGLAFAGPAVQAVVSAGFAARAARIAASRIEADRLGSDGDLVGGGMDPLLALRLAGIEAGQARIEAALAAEAESRAAAAAADVRLTELLAKVLRRLDAQADVLHGHIAREDKVAERLGEIAGLAAAPAISTAAFQETLGLALAEFLARLERRETTPAQGPARMPQVS